MFLRIAGAGLQHVRQPDDQRHAAALAMLLLLDPEHVFADLECVPVLQTFGRRLVRGVVRAAAHPLMANRPPKPVGSAPPGSLWVHAVRSRRTPRRTEGMRALSAAIAAIAAIAAALTAARKKTSGFVGPAIRDRHGGVRVVIVKRLSAGPIGGVREAIRVTRGRMEVG